MSTVSCQALLRARLRRGCGVRAAWLALGVLLSLPQLAHAQYKNTSFTLDAGGVFMTRPSLTDDAGNQLSNAQIPLRLAYGERLGGEVNLKLNSDRWWFTGRLNGYLFHFGTFGESSDSLAYAYDTNAQATIGTVFGIEGVAGVRYYLLTDRVRPYFQGAISYMHLFSFTGQSGDLCTLQGICADGGSYGDVFLPHTNILATHVQPGIEFIVSRDLSINVALDYQRWLVINSAGNNVFTLSVGVTFYG